MEAHKFSLRFWCGHFHQPKIIFIDSLSFNFNPFKLTLTSALLLTLLSVHSGQDDAGITLPWSAQLNQWKWAFHNEIKWLKVLKEKVDITENKKLES